MPSIKPNDRDNGIESMFIKAPILKLYTILEKVFGMFFLVSSFIGMVIYISFVFIKIDILFLSALLFLAFASFVTIPFCVVLVLEERERNRKGLNTYKPSTMM